jgi:hypothetical protein
MATKYVRIEGHGPQGSWVILDASLVPGTKGLFAIHALDAECHWSVDHVPTGCRIIEIWRTRREAMRIAKDVYKHYITDYALAQSPELEVAQRGLDKKGILALREQYREVPT